MDMYGLQMSGLPPEYQAQLRRAQQQQMIAQSLMDQSQESLGQQQPGVAVSPFQGLAKVAQAYVGAKALQQGNDAYAKVGEKYTADQTSAIEKVRSALAPRTLPDSSVGAPATMERSPEEKRAAVQDAILSPYANVRNFGTTLNSNMQADQAREDVQAQQDKVLADNREQRKQEKELAFQEQLRREAVEAQVRQQQFQHQQELKKLVASGQGQSPYFTPVQTADGVFAFNARTGRAEPVAVNGKQVVGAQYDPNLQGRIAEGKESGKVTGKATAEAKMDLPMAISKAELGLQQVDDMLAHPGLNSYVGATLKPGASLIDGTPEADFRKRLEQIQGTAFLQAFEGLKGGGQITEVEGKKATEAITRMNKSQSEKEFKAAAEEFKGYIKTGLEKAKQKSGQIPSKLNVKGPSSVDALLEKYK